MLSSLRDTTIREYQENIFVNIIYFNFFYSESWIKGSIIVGKFRHKNQSIWRELDISRLVEKR